MATRFYLPDTGTPTVTPTVITGWEQTAGWSSFPTDIAKTNTATNAGAARAKNSTTANNDRLDRVYISTQQLAAQTIAVGTFSAVIRAVQSAATTDAWLQILIRVVSADGTTERGQIYAGSTATTEVATVGNEAQEYGTASSTRIKSAIATSSVVAQLGDRIQIDIGARINGTTSADTFTHRYGDPTGSADFALTAGLTTDLCPWVELSQTLTWSTPITLADTGSAADAVTTTAAAPLADTGAGTDAVAVTTAVPLSDPRTIADALAVTATTALADTGTGADALTVTVPISLTDTGSAVDSLAVTIPKALTETGAGADGLTVAATGTLSDTGVAADDLAVSATATLTDTGSAADALAVTVPVSLADTGSGTDELTVAVITGPPHVPGTTVLLGNAATAVLVGNGTAAAILTAITAATAVLQPAAATAVLAGDGTTTAVLTGDGLGTAQLDQTVATATLQTT